MLDRFSDFTTKFNSITTTYYNNKTSVDTYNATKTSPKSDCFSQEIPNNTVKVEYLNQKLNAITKKFNYLEIFIDKFKNITHIGVGTSKVQKCITRFETGEITYKEAFDALSRLGNTTSGETIKDSSLNIKNLNAPKISDDIAQKTALRVSDNKEIQKALIEMATKEAIVIRTKEDAIPILQQQYNSLSQECKENLYVLNINPQLNNGMPKSNTLISDWYAEANNIPSDNVITITNEELSRINSNEHNFITIYDINSKFKRNYNTGKINFELIRLSEAPNQMDITEAIDIYLNSQNKDKKTSEEKLAQAIDKINKSGYSGALALKVKNIVKESNGKANFVIPDDCSLSGSSMICDTVKIIDKAFCKKDKSNANFIFSPMVYGDKAEASITKLIEKDRKTITGDSYLQDISAIKPNKEDNIKNAKSIFKKISDLKNINFSVTNCAIKAKHFTETETFKEIGKKDKTLQQKLLYIMQGPICQGGHLYGGYKQCGVMVITPTDEFELDEKKYAGKVPTNSVGFMEAIGIEAGVLYDNLPQDQKGKGLFIKGTGKGYSRYIEWNELASPTKKSDRINIKVENGIVKKAS